MKKINVILIFLIFSFSCTMQRQVQMTSQGQGNFSNISFQVFYDNLSPYGQWVNYQGYGFVWVPDVGPGFAPYSSNGQWIMTEYGWTWVSDYDWGWAPFHYGRWDYDNYFGWYWVPDNVWGPSWVTWRYGNGYYGWAPMRPGISVNMSFGVSYDINRWNFVPEKYFGRPNHHRYFVNRKYYESILQNSRVINNTHIDNQRNVTYVSGPYAEAVQRSTGRRVTSVYIRDNDRPGQRLTNDQLSIYRPQVKRVDNSDRRPAPPRVANIDDVRRARENQRGTIRQSGSQQHIDRRQNQQQQQQQSQQQQIETQRRVRQQEVSQERQNQSTVRQQRQQQNEVRRQERDISRQTERQSEIPRDENASRSDSTSRRRSR